MQPSFESKYFWVWFFFLFLMKKLDQLSDGENRNIFQNISDEFLHAFFEQFQNSFSFFVPEGHASLPGQLSQKDIDSLIVQLRKSPADHQDEINLIVTVWKAAKKGKSPASTEMSTKSSTAHVI
jgi:hypothetical protein